MIIIGRFHRYNLACIALVPCHVPLLLEVTISDKIPSIFTSRQGRKEVQGKMSDWLPNLPYCTLSVRLLLPCLLHEPHEPIRRLTSLAAAKCQAPKLPMASPYHSLRSFAMLLISSALTYFWPLFLTQPQSSHRLVVVFPCPAFSSSSTLLLCIPSCSSSSSSSSSSSYLSLRIMIESIFFFSNQSLVLHPDSSVLANGKCDSSALQV